jgi:ubiquinone/menaquinone biosynthesis C-methylase UbiE/glycosyltransferase involved in cell wall biosynthesis
MGVLIKQEKAPQPLSYTGERLTSAVSGQIEIEHLHRYLMVRELCSGKDALDVACGEGYGAAMLAQVARSVIGVDIHFGAIAHASGAYSREHLRFVVGNAHGLPLAAACFDVVVSFETLEHLSEQEQFLAEVRRVMRPGGLLVISTPDRDIYSEAEEQQNPFHKRELSRAEFAKLLAREFTHVALYGQRPVIGSVLIPQSETAAFRQPITFEKLDRDHLERCDGLPRALYVVAIASDRKIHDECPGSLYIDTGDVQAELGFDRTAARAQILELRAALYGWSAKTDGLRRELAHAREQVTSETSRLNAELARAHEQLTSQASRLKREARAREQPASPTDRQRAADPPVREYVALREVGRSLSSALRRASRNIPEVIRQMHRGLKLARRFRVFRLASSILRSSQTSRDVKLITSSGLFDREWYLVQYADVREAGDDAALHYLLHGGAEGRDPGPSFDNDWYLEENPDVRAAGDNPLVHYLRYGAAERRAPNRIGRDLELIASSELFDRDWYLARYADVREAGDDAALHYLLHGGAEGRDPGPSFDNDWYLEQNPDVRTSGDNPLVHYLRHGLAEGRRLDRIAQDVELIKCSALFDRDWYFDQYADVRETGDDAAMHYLRHGGTESRDPGPLFDSDWYLEENPDVRAAGDNPLVHYLRYGAAERRAPNRIGRDVEVIASSGLFDRDWYLARYADVREAGDDAALHYLLHGGAEGRDPGPSFDNDWYLGQNPDVRTSGDNPLVHYLRHGLAEGRKLDRIAQDVELVKCSALFDRDWYFGQYADVREAHDDAALHYLRHGGTEGRDPGPLFDSDWYLEQNLDVRRDGANPLIHYLRHGVAEGRNPNPLFDNDWYLAQNPDVRRAGLEPLSHYIQVGAAEGRNPSPRFDTRWYLVTNPEVATAGVNPLAHYLEWGLPEARPAHEPRQLLRGLKTHEVRCDVGVAHGQPLRHWTCPEHKHPGVNLIGPIEYVSGLGVSARGFAASLMHAGIALNVIPWRIGFQRLRPIPVDFPSRELQPINLIHLNLDLMHDRQLFDILPLAEIATPDRYNIAIIYWELAVVPSEWLTLIHRFDEIWCSSSFMARSIAAVSARPVRTVLPAVLRPPAPRKCTRGHFGLPGDRFVFGYVADAASQLGRKNPRFLIEAYVEEFAPDEDACCLIKLGYSNPSGAETRAMRAITARRPDIILIDRQLEEKELSGLYELIDCYVSPHRSEGLGLTILEAMNARKPVIATAYGGVTDFVTPDTALLIDYRLVEVGPGRVPYPKHAVWADPIKSSLRSAMRSMFSNRDLGMSLGLKGHAFARDMCSLDETARRIRAEIERIWVDGGGEPLDGTRCHQSVNSKGI